LVDEMRWIVITPINDKFGVIEVVGERTDVDNRIAEDDVADKLLDEGRLFSDPAVALDVAITMYNNVKFADVPSEIIVINGVI